ncbi:MAG: hypothetical protein JXA07_05480 [Spirochaetes bacterium]|nr:hypothetical protein [Spirochaetota bacterium]
MRRKLSVFSSIILPVLIISLLLSCGKAGGGNSLALLALLAGAGHSPGIGVPAGVVASNNDTVTLSITWSAVDDAQFYNVYRSDSFSGPYSLIGETDVTSYDDTTAVPGERYYYRVAAGMRSADTPPVEVVGEQSDPDEGYLVLLATTTISASRGSGSAVTVEWGAVDYASTYRVLRSLSEAGSYAEISSGITVLQHEDSVITPGTSYYYKVVAYSADGVAGIESVSAEGYIDETPPGLLGIPGDVAATENNTSSVTITWSAVTDARFYNVYRANSFAGPYELIGENNVTSYTDETPAPGEQYYYRVAAGWRSTGGTPIELVGDQSDPDGGYVQLAATAAISASIDSGMEVTVEWAAVEYAATYRVLRSLAESTGFTEIASDLTVTEYADTVALAGTRYYYRVVAYSADDLGGRESNTVQGYRCTDAPGNFVATDGTIFSYVRLTWDAAADTSGYEIFRDSSLITTVTATTYNDSGADSSGTVHFYQVVALHNNGGKSLPALDSGNRLNSSGTIPCTVSWTPNREKAVNSTGGGYYVYYSTGHITDTSGARVTVPYVSGDSTPATAIIPLGPGTWYFRVAGYSGLGGSPRASALSSEQSVVIY